MLCAGEGGVVVDCCESGEFLVFNSIGVSLGRCLEYVLIRYTVPRSRIRRNTGRWEHHNHRHGNSP